ncbi:hypothetical protein D9M73_216110 [compost metagenome]
MLARVGSLARSSRPMASMKRLKMASPLAPICTCRPSALVWIEEGVMPGMMLPVRSRIKPNTSNSGTMLSIMAKIASYSATSTT